MLCTCKAMPNARTMPHFLFHQSFVSTHATYTPYTERESAGTLVAYKFRAMANLSIQCLAGFSSTHQTGCTLQ